MRLAVIEVDASGIQKPLYTCTQGVADLLYIPAGWCVLESVMNGIDAIGLKLCVVPALRAEATWAAMKGMLGSSSDTKMLPKLMGQVLTRVAKKNEAADAAVAANVADEKPAAAAAAGTKEGAPEADAEDSQTT
jgi:hypothetical protein